MLRVVFDTVIFVRGRLNPKSRCGRILAQHRDEYRLFVSPQVLAEYLEVLHRPELMAKSERIAGLDMQTTLGIFRQAEVIEPGHISPISRDPNDDKFLALAAAARADYLVTEDKDLLVLETYQQVQIIDSERFLELLGRT